MALLGIAVDLRSGCGLAFGGSSARHTDNHHVLQFSAGFCGLSGLWRARGLLCHQGLVTSAFVCGLALPLALVLNVPFFILIPAQFPTILSLSQWGVLFSES